MADKTTYLAGPTLPEIMESVAPELAFQTRFASPLLFFLGWPTRVFNVENTKHSFMEDALLPNSAVIDNGGGPVLAATTVIPLVTGQGARFVVGDVVQPQGKRELMLVTAVAADTITVTRGHLGTTAEDIPDTRQVLRVANPTIENATAKTARPTVRRRISNYSQIFTGTASVTRTERKVKQLGNVGDELEHQVTRVEQDLMRDLGKSYISGKRHPTIPEGDDATPRTMDGIIHSILEGTSLGLNPSVIDAGGDAIDETYLNDGLQDSWSKGGQPRVIACGPTQKRRISALLEGRQRFGPGDSTLGVVVERFASDFGILSIIDPDIHIPDDVVLLLDPAKIRPYKIGTDRELWELAELKKDGLVDNREVQGEFGLEMKNARDGGHALIHGLAF